MNIVLFFIGFSAGTLKGPLYAPSQNIHSMYYSPFSLKNFHPQIFHKDFALFCKIYDRSIKDLVVSLKFASKNDRAG